MFQFALYVHSLYNSPFEICSLAGVLSTACVMSEGRERERAEEKRLFLVEAVTCRSSRLFGYCKPSLNVYIISLSLSSYGKICALAHAQALHLIWIAKKDLFRIQTLKKERCAHSHSHSCSHFNIFRGSAVLLQFTLIWHSFRSPNKLCISTQIINYTKAKGRHWVLRLCETEKKSGTFVCVCIFILCCWWRQR